MKAFGESLFGFLVKADVVSEMREIGQACTYLATEGDGLADENVALVGLLPSEGIHHKRIYALQIGKF